MAKNINVNTFFFTRTAPMTKLRTIETLTQSELLAITEATISRIIKEAGSGEPNSRNKDLKISRKNTTGNNWNSDIDEWYIWKKEVFIDFYLQYDNTDTTTGDSFKEFMKYPEYRGSYEYEDRYGHTQTTYFRYSQEDKANAIKALLREYIETKYHDKLQNNEEA